MKKAGSKLIKWSIIASLAVVLLFVSVQLLHGTVMARGMHEAAGFGHGGGRFIAGGERFERVVAVERHRGGIPLVGTLIKVGVLLLGAALFAKGKSVVKWGGALLAVVALWSLLSIWTVLIAAAIIAAYWLIRRKKDKYQGLEASPEWLNPGPAYSNAHILDQWEQQIRKESDK